MKYLFFIIPCIIYSTTYSQINVSSFNIRFENINDGKHQWENRKSSVIDFIKFESLDILGMQEVLYTQLDYLVNGLSGYGYEGIGRDDGEYEGEFSPIFFNQQTFERIDGGTFWLSPTQDVPSKAWDAVLPRICTWLHLEHIESKTKLFVFNTHFDHVGKVAREKSVEVILSNIKKIANNEAVLLLGDFNVTPDATPISLITNAGFKDSFNEAELKLGPSGTFNGFRLDGKYERRIDYIFSNHLNPKSYKCLSIRIEETFLSDHFPIVVKYKINE